MLARCFLKRVATPRFGIIKEMSLYALLIEIHRVQTGVPSAHPATEIIPLRVHGKPGALVEIPDGYQDIAKSVVPMDIASRPFLYPMTEFLPILPGIWRLV